VLDFSFDSYTVLPVEIAQHIQHIHHNTKVTEHNAVAGFFRRFSLYMLSTIYKNLGENLGIQETAIDNMLRDIYEQYKLKENY